MDISTVPGGTAGLILFGVVGFFAVVLVVVMIYARMYQKASPNEVLVISGRGSEPRLVIGSGQLVIPLFERVDRFSLETMTIELLTPEVYTAQGVPVIIDAVAQVKVRNEPDMVRLALERFLSKSPMEIKEIVKQTLEGHTRAIIGQMNVEGIITARDEFAQKVAEVSSRDLANMGLTIDSFSIKDVKDNQGYLAALGKPRTAEVKRDAAIAEANAARDAQKAAAGASQEAEVAKIEAKTRIAEKDRDFRIQQAEYNIASKQREAEADLSYDLQKNISAQKVKEQEVQIQVVEKQKQIQVQKSEAERREVELVATVRKPAEAKQYEIQTLATAEQFKLKTTAEGQAEANRLTGFASAEIRQKQGEAEAAANKAQGLAHAEVGRAQGLAEAEVIRAKGLSEAEAMVKKASAWSTYNQAAIMQMLIDRMPEIASAISAPLAKTEKIVMINSGEGGGGASRLTRDVTDVVAQMPAVLEALTGIDLGDLAAQLPGLGQKAKPEIKTASPAVPVARKGVEPPIALEGPDANS
jgi:flotillin